MNYPSTDSHQKWERVLEALHTRLGQADFRVWFGEAELAFVDGLDVGISVPTKFVRDYVDQQFQQEVRRYWERELPGLDSLQFIVRDASEAAAAPAAPQVAPADVFRLNRFPETRFQEISVGDGNRLAYDEVRQVQAAVARGEKVEPLFLCAPSGMGKTHLLLGLGADIHSITGGDPSSMVAYIPADRFVMQAVQAAREERIREFRQSVLASEVLLVDGLQFLEGKGWAADELLLVIDLGVKFGKAVVLAADRSLLALGRIGDRLAAIVPGHRVVDLSGSSADMRISIITGRAAAGAFQIEDEAAQIFAGGFKGSHRVMLEALKGAYSGLRPPRPLNAANIHELLTMSFPNGTADVPLPRILQAVSQDLRVTIRDLQSASRRAGIVRARQIAMFLAREFSAASLREVGAYFGGRDHTTVVNAISVVTAALKADPEIAGVVDALRTKLLAGV